MRWVVLSLYFGCLAVLSLYGAHRWYLLWLYRKHRRAAARPAGTFDELPRLTVQLPLYNELTRDVEGHYALVTLNFAGCKQPRFVATFFTLLDALCAAASSNLGKVSLTCYSCSL